MATSLGGWYYAVGQEQKGPFAVEHFRTLVAAGVVGRDTLVWSPTLTEWQPLWRTELATALGLGGGAPPPFAAEAPAVAYRSSLQSPGFVEAVRTCFSKFATFQGRATRPEFWYFFLFCILASLVASAVDLAVVGAESGFSPMSTITSLAVLVPSIAVAVRRLHDTDRVGWWYWAILIPLLGFIALVVFWCQKGSDGPNRFG